MAKASTEQKNTQVQTSSSSWGEVLSRFNSIMGQFADMTGEGIYAAFGRAWANMPSVQNSRVKAISPLPCDYTKVELGDFLRTPQNNELPLQEIAEGLRWTNYSWYKRIKSYADMLQFHSIVLPQDVAGEEINSDSFRREYRLVYKLLQALSPKQNGRKIATQSETQGKVYYVPRFDVDRSHNSVNYFFLQELPKQWCTIIGKNSVSDWTISFNLMYFMQLGTDPSQFGDLFLPYMDDFAAWQKNQKPIKGKFIYASRNNARMETQVKAWQQNGKWFYYVSLPIDRVWTFDIDPSTAIVASPFAGLMQTDAQQAEYEAAQLSLILNPLIKIFTGEIPYNDRDNATQEDSYKLSDGGLNYFIYLFENLMRRNNTDGVGFYGAPFQNIKSHDFPESANANSVSNSFLQYSGNKAGLNALVPITDRPTQGMAEVSAKLESQFAQNVYRTFDKMINYILDTLNLRYEWRVQFWGDVYSDDIVRSNALKLIDKGDLWGWILLSSLDDISIFEHVSANRLVKAAGLTESLEIPPTAYTQSGNSQSKSDTGGAPVKDESKKNDTKIEKETQGTTEDGE